MKSTVKKLTAILITLILTLSPMVGASPIFYADVDEGQELETEIDPTTEGLIGESEMFGVEIVSFSTANEVIVMSDYSDAYVGLDGKIVFPDPNFAAAIEEDYPDGLTPTEAAEVYSLHVYSREISSLAGIEYFVGLVGLYCRWNNLTALDVSQNSNLVVLDCEANQLTELDVSKNVELIALDCSYNDLTILDISQNIKLQNLRCAGNKLKELDVSKNVELTNLICDENQLQSLDVSQNVELLELGCGGGNQLTELDVSNNEKLIYLYIGGGRLESLDVSKNVELTTLYCGELNLTTLDISQNVKLESLDCSDNNLTTLDISNNTMLTQLNCGQNPLTVIDVMKNEELVILECSRTQITELDVRNNLNLAYLKASYNKLTELDVSNNTKFFLLICNGNQLTSITSMENLSKLEYVDISSNNLNLDSTAVKNSIAKIQATVDKNLTHNNAFYYTPQNTFTVTFIDHDGSTLKTESVYYGAVATAPVAPTRAGYTFVGWDKSFANVTEYLTVTAQYTQNTYTATVSSLGTGASGSGDYAEGVTVSINAGNRSGYTFNGWTASPNVTFANARNASTTFIMPAENVTVTANWTRSQGGNDQGDNSNNQGGNNQGGNSNNQGGNSQGGNNNNQGGNNQGENNNNQGENNATPTPIPTPTPEPELTPVLESVPEPTPEPEPDGQREFPQESLIPEEIIAEILTQENPILDLSEAETTVITADLLQAIAESGKDVVVVLESGYEFTIVADSITADAVAFDLNIEIYLTSRAETIVGVNIPANAIVVNPNFSGEFGFDIKISFTEAELLEHGVNGNNVRLFHIDHDDNVTELDRVRRNADGSVEFSISHASYYVLSEDAPTVIMDLVPLSDIAGGNSRNPALWLWIGGGLLIAVAAVIIVPITRRRSV